MNINEYIKKYSTVDVDKKTGLVTVAMEVPPRKVIHYKHEECEESKKVKIRTSDVQEYLVNSGMQILSARTGDAINNNNKLTARWEYNITPTANKSKIKRNKMKEYTDEAV
jgi:hypothetical protein|tara:strand:+ start:206 stop:538 length:333 start_codon:yes stop_codon:yes gene_type:complete